MSSTEKFLRSSMRTSSAALCQAVGWDATHSSALDVLSDVYSKYFMEIAKRIHHYAEHSGRSDANLEDVALVLDDMQVSVGELEEYVAHFDPVPFPVKVPQFPLEKESHLNFLRPGSEEVVTRPVHVHEYMPPMIIEEESGKRQSKKIENELTPSSSSAIDKLDSVDGLENDASVERTNDNVLNQVNGKIKNTGSELEVVTNTNDSDDTDSDSSASRVLRNSKSPQSPKTPKSGKRLDSPGENPALKRVRMLLEEEGNPVKEITSVMMTTSGFLTSSREGKLPESKPPPNTDFFEPTPAVEKRKKIPTMKKIVEGVKKIEKDRDGSRERSDSSLGLFEKPDNIYTTGAAASDSSKERHEKDTEKVKEGKDRSKDRKDRNGISLDKIKMEKKSSSHKDEGRDRQKLKIFKKKIGKDGTVKSKSKHRKTDKIEVSARQDSGIVGGSDEGAGLDAIESEEDFGSTKLRATSPSKKIRKKKDKSSHLRLKQKKLKLAAKKLAAAASAGLQIKISKAQQKAAAAAALAAADPVRIFETPDQIVTAVVGSQKKKRGRPKKSASPFSISPISLQASPTTPLKSMKVNRKSLAQTNEEIDFKMMVPDISINVKPPEFMKKIPLQPGLIPAAFASPPSMKLPNQFPPSLSVTPATPIPLSPGSGLKESSRNSAQFGNLPSSVCSSVTITRIDMSSTQKLPTPFDNQSTPGIGSPNLSNLSNKSSSSVSSATQPDSGITITPIVLEKQGLTGSPEKVEKVHPSVSGLAKLEQKINSKEQRKREKEKRKELRKEKKKEKKEKMKEKSRKVDKIPDKDRDKISKKDKKEKSEKKRKKEKDLTSPVEAIVPKLTLKLQHSSNSTPVDSPNPPQAYLGDPDHQINPLPRKITIKPIEETKSQHQRTPSPELARFSPLVTRPSKNKLPPLKKAPILPILKTPKQEVVSFPPASSSSTTSSGGGKRGRGRPPKANAKTPGKASSVTGAGTQAGLVTETVGSYIDEHGTKIWICPSCGRQDDGSPMIGCEKCDDWYHFLCVGIVDPPDENEAWFCRKCQDNKKARR